jgi:hypothetical protein
VKGKDATTPWTVLRAVSCLLSAPMICACGLLILKLHTVVSHGFITFDLTGRRQSKPLPPTSDKLPAYNELQQMGSKRLLSVASTDGLLSAGISFSWLFLCFFFFSSRFIC